MNATAEIPIVSADAGDPAALSNPNSPAALARKAQEQASQSSADTKYDATPPERVSQGFTDYSLCTHEEIKLTGASTFLSLSILLLLYAVAPNPN